MNMPYMVVVKIFPHIWVKLNVLLNLILFDMKRYVRLKFGLKAKME